MEPVRPRGVEINPHRDDSGPQPFRCRVETKDGTLTVRITGELDMATEPEAREALRAAVELTKDGLVCDLREVTFLSSCGLRLLLETHDQLSARGYRLELMLGEASERILDMTGVKGRFQIGRP